jgi:hypothetical protein
MTSSRNVRNALYALLFAANLVFAQSNTPDEVFQSTTLVEISPVVAAEYHRVHGKIEGAIQDQTLKEELASRFSGWLQDAGSEKPQQFEAAVEELISKIKKVDQEFDKAKAAGTLEQWLKPANATPTNNPEIKAAQEIVSPPDSSMSESGKGTKEDPKLADRVNEKREIFMLAGAILGALFTFSIYPRFIESNSKKYSNGIIRRLTDRFGYSAAVGGIVGAIGGLVLLTFLSEKFPQFF